MGENADNATPEKTMVKDRPASGLSSNWRIILLVGVPIIRIRAQRSYSIDELRRKLEGYLPVGFDGDSSAVPQNDSHDVKFDVVASGKGSCEIATTVKSGLAMTGGVVESGLAMTDVDLQDIAFTKEIQNEVKVCPDCGKEMVLREAKRGPNKGQQFWGCSGYPECKGILSVEELRG